MIELRSKNGDLESSSASSLLKQRELEHRITQLNGDVQQLNAKLAESEQVIASNQNVIMYLNQLVNTEQIGSYIPFLDDYKSAPSSGMTCEPKTPAGLPKSSRSRYDGINPLSEGGGGMPTTVGKASVVSYSPDSVTQQPAHYERQDHAQTPYYRTPAANHGRESNQSPPHSMTGDNEIYLQGLRYLGLGSSPSKLKVCTTIYY